MAIVSAEAASNRLRPGNVPVEDLALLNSVWSWNPLSEQHVEGFENLSHEGLKGIVVVVARYRDVRLAERRLVFSDPDPPNLHRNRLQHMVASFTEIIDPDVLRALRHLVGRRLSEQQWL